MKRTWVAMVGVNLCLAAMPSQAAEREAKLTVDTAKPGAVINRNILGQLSEHLGRGIYEGIWVGPDSKIPNTRGIRKDVTAALKALHVPNVRWPGGCFGDSYHWRNGIGKDRPATLNASWGGVLEPNTFGTHEFMDFVEQIGSEAYISVNVGSATPQEMAEWLEYMTTDKPSALGKLRAANGREKPWKLALLGLGNESWGCGGTMTAAEYGHEMRRFATFARNFNPHQKGADKMQRIAVGPDRDDYAWTEQVMKDWTLKSWSWGLEGVSLHSYTWPKRAERATGFNAFQYAELLKSTLWMEELVTKHSAIMDKYDPEKKVGLYVDEWGTWFKEEEEGAAHASLYQQSTQRDAVVAAVNLNIFARHADRVRGANIAQTINVLQSVILTDGDKMLLTPTYHLFRMYTPFQDAKVVPMTYEAGTYQEGAITLPRLDAMAAVGKDGKLWLSLTNLDPRQPLKITPTVAGYNLKGAKGETLAGDDMGAFNTFAAPTRVKPQAAVVNTDGTLELPPHSVTLIGLDPVK